MLIVIYLLLLLNGFKALHIVPECDTGRMQVSACCCSGGEMMSRHAESADWKGSETLEGHTATVPLPEILPATNMPILFHTPAALALHLQLLCRLKTHLCLFCTELLVSIPKLQLHQCVDEVDKQEQRILACSLLSKRHLHLQRRCPWQHGFHQVGDAQQKMAHIVKLQPVFVPSL